MGYAKVIYGNELYHHGIKGQKWGIRRFQNEDGSLTEAGKKRQGYREGRINKKRVSLSSHKKMSDEELKKEVERLKKEVEYLDLKKKAEPGKAYVIQILQDIGKKVITTASAGALLYALKSALGGQFDAAGLASAVFNGGAKKK